MSPVTDELLLKDDFVEDYEETDDESDQEQLGLFMTLMNKAEKKNEKRKLIKQNRFENSKSDWRNVRLGVGDVADSSDTEDEDDREEVERFMSLMDGAKAKNRKQGKVKICWVNGKIQYSRATEEEATSVSSGGQTSPGLVSDGSKTMVKLVRDEPQALSKEELLQRRKAEFRERLLSVGGEMVEQNTAKRKRKFGERMTLSEAEVEDFGNSQDYVNFLQEKLQGVRIKLLN